MIKQILSLLLLTSAIFANDNIVEIVADKFEMDQKTNITKFIGKVRLTQGDDWLVADIVNVFSDKDNKAKRYEAIGNVKFESISKEAHYKGDCKYLEYFPETKRYILVNKATVLELIGDKKLQGDKVILDRLTGKHEVFGGKDPAKYRFDSTK